MNAAHILFNAFCVIWLGIICLGVASLAVSWLQAILARRRARRILRKELSGLVRLGVLMEQERDMVFYDLERQVRDKIGGTRP